MSVVTMNPPLPFTREAIIGNLQLHATNGPAYVQIQATNSLARIKGLFQEAKSALQTIVKPTKPSRFAGLKFDGFGGYCKDAGEPTPELAATTMTEQETTEDDEESGKEKNDDIP